MLYLYHIEISLNRLNLQDARIIAKLRKYTKDYKYIRVSDFKKCLNPVWSNIQNNNSTTDYNIQMLLNAYKSLKYITVEILDFENIDRRIRNEFVFEFKIVNALIDFNEIPNIKQFFLEFDVFPIRDKVTKVKYDFIKPKEFAAIFGEFDKTNETENILSTIFSPKLLFDNPITVVVWSDDFFKN